MADITTSYSLERGTASILQASTQYTAGVLTGMFIDWGFLHWQVPEGNLPLRVLKLMLQAGANGYALSMLLPWLHPRNVSNYTDPTGGYLLAFGLLQSQPTMGRNAKEIVTSVLELYQETFLPALSQPPVEEEVEAQ